MIGTLAAAALGGPEPISLGSYESIASTIVGSGGVASITFTSGGAWANYKHLQIRISQTGGTGDWQKFYFNGDTSNSYRGHLLRGNGSAAEAYDLGAYVTDSMWYALQVSSSYPLVSVIDILDFANTSKNTTTRLLWGNDANGSGQVGLTSGLYTKTDAITSITFKPNTGSNNIPEFSTFALYGIKD